MGLTLDLIFSHAGILPEKLTGGIVWVAPRAAGTEGCREALACNARNVAPNREVGDTDAGYHGATGQNVLSFTRNHEPLARWLS